jgi:hypothetical protein
MKVPLKALNVDCPMKYVSDPTCPHDRNVTQQYRFPKLINNAICPGLWTGLWNHRKLNAVSKVIEEMATEALFLLPSCFIILYHWICNLQRAKNEFFLKNRYWFWMINHFVLPSYFIHFETAVALFGKIKQFLLLIELGQLPYFIWKILPWLLFEDCFT